jgi:hypothetical protein
VEGKGHLLIVPGGGIRPRPVGHRLHSSFSPISPRHLHL